MLAYQCMMHLSLMIILGLGYLALLSVVAVYAWRATMCITTDPIIELQREHEQKTNDLFEPIGKGQDGKDLHLWCNVCDCYVNESAKHCGACNRCTLDFDHHCNWLNNCIGELNYWDFYYLIWQFLFLLAYFDFISLLSLIDWEIYYHTWLFVLVIIQIVSSTSALIYTSKLIDLHRWL